MADFLRSVFSRARDALVHETTNVAKQVQDKIIGQTASGRKVFNAISFDEASTLKTTAPFASDLSNLLQGHTPKYKFLFFVEVELNEPYASQMSNEFTFMVNRATVPQVEYEYEEINFYNHFSKVPKRAMFNNCSFTFYDDVANTVSNFIQDYHRAMIPIVNFDDALTTFPEKALALQSPGMFFDKNSNSPGVTGGVGHKKLGPLSGDTNAQTVHKYAATIGPLGEFDFSGQIVEGSSVKNIMNKMRIYQIFTFPGSDDKRTPAMRANIYTLYGPKIISASMEELSMEDGASPSQWTIDVAYDTYYVQESIPIISSVVPEANKFVKQGQGDKGPSKAFQYNLYGYTQGQDDLGVQRYGSGYDNTSTGTTAAPPQNEQDKTTDVQKAAARNAAQQSTTKSNLERTDQVATPTPQYDESASERHQALLAETTEKKAQAKFSQYVTDNPNLTQSEVNDLILQEHGVDPTLIAYSDRHQAASDLVRAQSEQEAVKELGAADETVSFDKHTRYDGATKLGATPSTINPNYITDDAVSTYKRRIHIDAHIQKSATFANTKAEQEKRLTFLKAKEEEIKSTKVQRIQFTSAQKSILTQDEQNQLQIQYTEKALNQKLNALSQIKNEIKQAENDYKQLIQGG